MSDPGDVEIVGRGPGQNVGPPAGFRHPGDRARVRRAVDGLRREPIGTDIADRFADVDRFPAFPFLEH